MFNRSIRCGDVLVFFTIFSYIVFGNSLTFNLGNRFPVKFAELLSIFTCIYLLFSTQPRFRKNSIFIGILGWVLYGWFCALLGAIRFNYSISELLYGCLYGGRIIHLLCLAYLISRYLIKVRHYSSEKLSKFILNCYSVVGIIGIFQLIFFPIAYDWYDLFYRIGVYFPNPDPHINRLVSTYFDPNFLSSILIIPITIQLYFILFRQDKCIWAWGRLVLLIITVFLTASRSGLVGAALTIFILLVIYIKKYKFKQWLFVFFLIALICVPFLLLSDIRVINRIINFASDPSASARFSNWAYSWNLFLDNFIFGIGYNMLGAYRGLSGVSVADTTGYGVDASIFQVLITTGIVGLILLCLFVAKILNVKSKANLHFATINKAVLIASCAVSFFNNLLFYVLWLFPFLLLLKVSEDEELIAERRIRQMLSKSSNKLIQNKNIIASRA